MTVVEGVSMNNSATKKTKAGKKTRRTLTEHWLLLLLLLLLRSSNPKGGIETTLGGAGAEACAGARNRLHFYPATRASTDRSTNRLTG